MDFDDLDGAEVDNVQSEVEQQAAAFKEYYAAFQPYYTSHPDVQPLRFGVLSTASIMHAGILGPALKSPQAAEIIGIASRSPEQAITVKAAVAPALAHAKVFTTYQDLLDNPDIDCVYNPLPNGMHYEWTKKALEAGKHVLLEKPFTANAAEAKQLVQLAKEKGLVLMEAHHWYHHPVREKLVEIIKSGIIGKLEEINFMFHLKMGLPPVTLKRKGTFDTNSDSGKMWIMRRGMAGGLTMTLGTYDINIIRTMIGEEPIVTWAEGTCLADDREMDAIMKAELFFPKSGVKGFFEAGGMGPEEHHNEMVIKGSEGTISTSDLMEPQYFPNKITVANLEGVELTSQSVTVSGGGFTTYDLQLLAFVDHVRQVKAGECDAASFPLTGDDNLRQMEVIDQVYANASMRPRWGGSGIVSSIRWSVSDKGGAVVRKTADAKSKELGKLKCGAIIEGPLEDDCWVNFKKLEGEGPDSGWVNLQLKDHWTVSDKDGAFVMEEKKDAESEKLGTLSCGAIVQGSLEDDGWVHFKKVEGEGPDSGWVQLKPAKPTQALKPLPAVGV